MSLQITQISPKHSESEVPDITREQTSSEYHFDRKFQANISPSYQVFEQPYEELLELKEKKHMKSNMFSSEHIHNGVLNTTYEQPSSEYHFESKFQAIFLHLIKVSRNKKKNW